MFTRHKLHRLQKTSWAVGGGGVGVGSPWHADELRRCMSAHTVTLDPPTLHQQVQCRPLQYKSNSNPSLNWFSSVPTNSVSDIPGGHLSDFMQLPLEPLKLFLQLFFSYTTVIPKTCKQMLVGKINGVPLLCWVLWATSSTQYPQEFGVFKRHQPVCSVVYKQKNVLYTGPCVCECVCVFITAWPSGQSPSPWIDKLYQTMHNLFWGLPKVPNWFMRERDSRTS